MPEIARKLTQEKVETPTLYNLKHGIKIRRTSEFPEIWSNATIKGILDQIAYAGHTVNFQTTKNRIKTRNKSDYPKKIG